MERLLLADYTIVKVSDRIEDCSDFDLRPDADPEDAVPTWCPLTNTQWSTSSQALP